MSVLSDRQIKSIGRAMERLPDPDLTDSDNPEWTEADFARARTPEDVFPPPIAAVLRRRGRPAGSRTSDRKQVTLRLPRAVIEHFKAGGPGWQTRAVAVLEREARESK